MYLKAFLVAALLETAAAYPQVANNLKEPRKTKTPPLEKGNFGAFPYYPGKPTHASFNYFNAAEQKVPDGAHPYKKPSRADIRGPCAGLNAAANHGYLARDGIATREDVLSGLNAAYGLAPDLLLALQTLTMFFDGDPITGYWSIGPASKKTYALSSIQEKFGIETGICNYGHLKTEADSSITRGDWLAPTDNNNCLSYPQYTQGLLDLADEYGGGMLTPQIMAYHQYLRKQHSIATNPNYFSPPYAGVAFTFGAHMFAWELLANRSAENPKGILTKEVFMSFFGYERKKDGSLHYKLGQEKIPDNWYRRSQMDQWDTADVGLSTAQQCVSYPSNCAVGGNTGKVNSFVGIDPHEASGGLINDYKEFQNPTTFLCFLQANLQAEIPSFLDKTFSGAALQAALAQVSKLLPGALESFGKCPGTPKGKSILQYSKRDKYPGLKLPNQKSIN